MAREAGDWRHLRPALAALAAALLVAAASVMVSAYYRAQMQRGFEEAERRFRAASSRYLALDEQERLLREDYPRFVSLYNAGIVGDERRLSWVEALRAARSGIGIPELGWRIAAREPRSPPPGTPARHFRVHTSRMTLDLGLLHEGDLFALLGRLEAARGLYTVERCDLRRARPRLRFAADARNVTGRCELAWLTLLPAGGEELAL